MESKTICKFVNKSCSMKPLIAVVIYDRLEHLTKATKVTIHFMYRTANGNSSTYCNSSIILLSYVLQPLSFEFAFKPYIL